MAAEPAGIELEEYPSEQTEGKDPTETQSEPDGKNYQTEHELREEELCFRIIEGITTATVNGLVAGAFLFLCIKTGFSALGASLAAPAFGLCLGHLWTTVYETEFFSFLLTKVLVLVSRRLYFLAIPDEPVQSRLHAHAGYRNLYRNWRSFQLNTVHLFVHNLKKWKKCSLSCIPNLLSYEILSLSLQREIGQRLVIITQQKSWEACKFAFDKISR
jgi:hypothetical protein